MNVPNPTIVYHITHLNNLRSIINYGGLMCITSLKSKNLSYKNIAHMDIQNRRARFMVPVEPGGNLHDYVPFYFAPRSPMLFTINKGNVDGYSDGQGSVIYLVTDAQTVKRNSIPYCFTDGHGIMHITEYYKDLKDLDKIDWDVMRARYWNDTEEDNDRKRRRQAEFLVHNFLPLEYVKKICVINNTVKNKVEQILHLNNVEIPVFVERAWYF